MRNYYFGSRKWILLWVFTALWFSGLALGTISAIIDGVEGPDNHSTWYPFVVFGLMWGFGSFLAWLCNNHPCISVTVEHNGVVEGRVNFPFRVVRSKFRYEEVIPLQLVENKFEDGDFFFVLRLPVQLVPGHDMVLAEGSHAHCLEYNAAFFAALRQGEREPMRIQG